MIIKIIIWLIIMLIVPYNVWCTILYGETPIIEYIKEKKLSYELNHYRNNKSNNSNTNTSNKTN